jgi:GH15 family glucan-1,4-alpha-glucosidase
VKSQSTLINVMQTKTSINDSNNFHTKPESSTFLPIEDYAIIGDCRSAALVSHNGSIDWLCFPNFSGASLFAALLDPERGGRFGINPLGEFQAQRRYVAETNVLETTFKTRTGIARLTDCMTVPVESEARTSLLPQREVLRIVEVVEGEVELEFIYEPRPDFARAKARLRQYGQLGWGCAYRDELFMLHANIPFDYDPQGKTLSGQLRLTAGDKRHLSLTYTKRDIAVILPLGTDADKRLLDTLQWWSSWSKQLTYDGPYRDMVLRSVLTLKLMTYSLSGAVVAAPTASLPEKIGGVRNWDYRFCWLRDASLTLAAFDDLGFRSENEEFLAWLLHATRLSWPKLQVLYDVYGETELIETTLDHFRGYRNSRPVRVGNAAHAQTQLDVYGEVILAVYDAVQHGIRLDAMEARMLTGLGRTICKQWRQPDQGIWEARNEGLHNTYSKAMCWVGLDCLLRLAEQGHIRIPYRRFQDEREAIRHAVETQGFNKTRGSYDTAFGVDEVDASLLLLARCGFIDANHPRMIGTYERIERELGDNGLIYRFRAGFDDFLPPGEGSFGIASFWAIDYLALRGDLDKATQRFERLLSYANDLGLYAEEIDPQTGAALGNFPQAFTHVGLINAALTLQKADKHKTQQR